MAQVFGFNTNDALKQRLKEAYVELNSDVRKLNPVVYQQFNENVKSGCENGVTLRNVVIKVTAKWKYLCIHLLIMMHYIKDALTWCAHFSTSKQLKVTLGAVVAHLILLLRPNWWSS